MGKHFRYFLLFFFALIMSAARLGLANEVWLLDLKGPLGPANAGYLDRSMALAQTAGAEAVILRMDTPGGLDTAMRDVIHRILAMEIPVIGYVAPQGSRAASAGTYILYASHVAAMAPATNLGAATPVQIGGTPSIPDFGKPAPEGKDEATQNQEDSPAESQASTGDTLKNKVINDARAYIRGLAELRGRNVEWAESAVTSAATLAATQALEENVIDLIADDVDHLLRQLDGVPITVGKATITLSTGNMAIKTVTPDWRTRFLGVITNPSVAYILLMVGLYGLILEFSNPGIGAGGVIGGICLFIALYALQLLPISYSALALLLLGLGLMVAEAFSPSFGILGLGGVVAFVVGSIMLIDSDVPGFQIALPVILAFAAVSAGLLALVVGMLVRTRRQQPVSGTQTLLDQTTTIVAIHQQHAMVRLQGELWRVNCPVPLSVGDRIKVTGVRGLTLDVSKESEP
jgi:membrane-bound serine protease (ClpP class)